MFFDEDDKLFGGTPKSKFFDIIYNASRGLAEQELENLIEELCIYEMYLEEKLADDFNPEAVLSEYKFNKSKELESRKNDRFIESVGNILTNNE